MLHLLEVNNRAMTAIAARELGLKAGMTEEQARAHAADAINVTHNDYSYGNTPRLFMAQAKGLTGGAAPPDLPVHEIPAAGLRHDGLLGDLGPQGQDSGSSSSRASRPSSA